MRVRGRFVDWCLGLLGNKPCPDRFSVSDGTADYYEVRLDDERGSFLVEADSVSEGRVSVRLWDGISHIDHDPLSIDTIDPASISINHHYKTYRMQYQGLRSFVVKNVLGVDFLALMLKQLFSAFRQHLYNRRPLIIHERAGILKVIEVLGHREPPGLYSIIREIQGTDMWMRHPDRSAIVSRTELIVESWLSDGAIRRVGSNYIITGAGIAALDELERDERRHRDQTRLQQAMVFLTKCLVVVGLIQAFISAFS